uniref:Uncharacterized protein n=1 Tax=Romanomermis culicivorax TaxID=13658 RepID=A0A915LBL4_ROMCU
MLTSEEYYQEDFDYVGNPAISRALNDSTGENDDVEDVCYSRDLLDLEREVVAQLSAQGMYVGSQITCHKQITPQWISCNEDQFVFEDVIEANNLFESESRTDKNFDQCLIESGYENKKSKPVNSFCCAMM